MPSEHEDRLDLGCIVGNLAATIVTKGDVVYQGTILDWDCGGVAIGRTDDSSSDSEDSPKETSPIPRRVGECCRSFIRMELTCLPGNICCPTILTDTVSNSSRVTTIRSAATVGNLTPLYAIGTTVLINWDDVSSIGSIGTTPVCLTS